MDNKEVFGDLLKQIITYKTETKDGKNVTISEVFLRKIISSINNCDDKDFIFLLKSVLDLLLKYNNDDNNNVF